MANNRLYCVCVKCKEGAYLGKHFGVGFDESDICFNVLKGFFNAHQYCDGAVTLKYEFGNQAETELNEDGYKIFINGEQNRFLE
jgi:hypothetical protein